jgi:predicted SnoaL-like aldol condensation-catalyzing enzyme
MSLCRRYRRALETMGTVDDSKAVMRKMVEMFATGDLAELQSVVSPEYLDHQGLGDREIHGPEGFRRLVIAIHRHPNTAVRVSIEDLIGEGDRAAARLRWLHTSADGTVVERETIDIIRCTDAQAVEHWGAEVSAPRMSAA